MLNQYPLWKNALVVLVLIIGVIYAMPNLYVPDPAIQIAGTRTNDLTKETADRIEKELAEQSLSFKSGRFDPEEKTLVLRFDNNASQLKASEYLKNQYTGDYVVALTQALNTPEWLQSFGAMPLYLGLDLRGGVHFLLDVDIEEALDKAQERYARDVRAALRDEKIRYQGLTYSDGVVSVKLKNQEDKESAEKIIRKDFPSMTLLDADDPLQIKAAIAEQEIAEIKDFALEQNIVTLRNRVNELGVAEPIVQRQGERRIVVQLPGVSDPLLAKEILGATATLEYRPAVSDQGDLASALDGRVPPGTELYRDRDGQPVLLKKKVIATGDQIVDARSGFDENSQPAVTVRLDGRGGRSMDTFTKDNVGKPMAVVFIENKTITKKVDGKIVKEKKRIEEVISVATIRGRFSNRFQTTGLDSSAEARNLALLLRAGALAAPVDIVEERTIGPSLGQDNIDQGFEAIVLGFVLVVLFMLIYYRFFGLIAGVALVANLVLIVGILSLPVIQAALTLPGIAGIVLTVGMAVDANVLIFERIREELRNGNTPQASINAGYEKAFSTIADANLTTFIAAVVLFGLGSGPVKGFAVTLSIGILTSMFTAIMGTRVVVNLVYGGRRKLQKLAI